MPQKTKYLLSKNKSKITIKTKKKRKVEDMEVRDQVLLHDNTKKRKKGVFFKGPAAYSP